MKFTRNIAVAAVTLAFGIAPAVALAGGPGKSSAAPGHNKTTTTTTAGGSSPTKAYGHFCQGESKKHVAGERGTPFSQCVVALAHANRDARATARAACSSLSKKHVAGQTGTPFSECVTAVAKLRAS